MSASPRQINPDFESDETMDDMDEYNGQILKSMNDKSQSAFFQTDNGFHTDRSSNLESSLLNLTKVEDQFFKQDYKTSSVNHASYPNSNLVFQNVVSNEDDFLDNLDKKLERDENDEMDNSSVSSIIPDSSLKSPKLNILKRANVEDQSDYHDDFNSNSSVKTGEVQIGSLSHSFQEVNLKDAWTASFKPNTPITSSLSPLASSLASKPRHIKVGSNTSSTKSTGTGLGGPIISSRRQSDISMVSDFEKVQFFKGNGVNNPFGEDDMDDFDDRNQDNDRSDPLAELKMEYSPDQEKYEGIISSVAPPDRSTTIMRGNTFHSAVNPAKNQTASRGSRSGSGAGSDVDAENEVENSRFPADNTASVNENFDEKAYHSEEGIKGVNIDLLDESEKLFNELEYDVMQNEASLMTSTPGGIGLSIPGIVRFTNFRISFRPFPGAICDCDSKEAGFHSLTCPLQQLISTSLNAPDPWRGLLSEGKVVRFEPPLNHSFEIPVLAMKKLEVINYQELNLITKGVERYRLNFRARPVCLQFFKMCSLQCFPSNLRDTLPFLIGKPRAKTDLVKLNVSYASSMKPCWNLCNLLDDYKRLGMLDHERLKLLNQTEKYEFCKTYPRQVIIPKIVSDHDLKKSCQFRSKARFPVAVWLHKKNDCVIARCAQPMVGLINARSYEDEKIVVSLLMKSGYELYNVSGHKSESADSGISRSTSTASEVSDGINIVFSGLLKSLGRQAGTSRSNPQFADQSYAKKSERLNHELSCAAIEENDYFYIMDARSQIATYGNRAVGRGTENPNNYLGCRLKYMSIENIHGLSRSYDELSKIIQPEFSCDSFFRAIDETGWLKQVRAIIMAAVEVVEYIDKEGKSVLVHCSDGWDRTAQITSLAELFLDPHYRTVIGFISLIEKEWFAFGHKFRDRLGFNYQTTNNQGSNLPSSVDPTFIDQMSPVFLLFLDSVWQILYQFPSAFEFNEDFLLTLSKLITSGRYGNFFANSLKDRHDLRLPYLSESVWQGMISDVSLRNKKYKEVPSTLLPDTSSKYLRIWKQNYFATQPSLLL